jgi:hypothetical protein
MRAVSSTIGPRDVLISNTVGFISAGSICDAHDNALCETTIGLYKIECVRDSSPFRSVVYPEVVAAVEE